RTKFILKENASFVLKEIGDDVQYEYLAYVNPDKWRRNDPLSEWEKGNLILKVKQVEQEGITNKYKDMEFEMFPDGLKEEAMRRYSILEPVLKGDIKPSQISEYIESLQGEVRKSAFYDWKKRWDTH